MYREGWVRHMESERWTETSCRRSALTGVDRDQNRTTYSEAKLLKLKEDVAEGVVMSVKFDLARTVKENVVLAKFFQAFLEPLEIVLEFLQGIQNAAVGT